MHHERRSHHGDRHLVVSHDHQFEHSHKRIGHQDHEDEPEHYWTSHELPELAEERHIQHIEDTHRVPLISHMDEEVTPYEEDVSYGHHYGHGDAHVV